MVGTALANEADHVLERRELAEFQVLIARDVVVTANLREHLGLLDRIDAEVGFEIQFEVEHVGRIVRLLGNDADDLRLDVVGGSRLERRSYGFRFGCGSRCRFGSRLQRRSYRGRGGGFRSRLWSGDGCRCRFWLGSRLERRSYRRALVLDAEPAAVDLDFGVLVSTESGQPGVPAFAVGNAVLEAQLVGIAAPAVRRRHPARQAHGQLRSEACTKAQRILHRVAAAGRQVQLAQIRVDFLEVRHGRNDAGFECLERDDILDAGAHCVTRESLGIGDHDLVGLVAEY